MLCEYQEICGGCCYRHLSPDEYRKIKEQKVKALLDARLSQADYTWHNPIFLPDGSRRRACLAFEFKKGKLRLGFNENHSNQIIDCNCCLMLTQKLNDILPNLRNFLERLCAIKILKGKKQIPITIQKGDINILEAENGIDMVLDTEVELDLNHRLEICDYINSESKIIRFSVRKKVTEQAEVIIEKIKPIIKIGGFDVYVAPATFLQASKSGEQALTDLVMRHIGNTTGKIADLFCGIGTFSYPLAGIKENKITAVDVNQSLLEGFRLSINRQMLHNVEVVQRNLFKYPLENSELTDFDVVIFDPPRAGASAQINALAKLNNKRPQKIIAVSCNPHSFINDANTLISAGYKLKDITMVDQFVYSNHSELVALFTN